MDQFSEEQEAANALLAIRGHSFATPDSKILGE